MTHDEIEACFAAGRDAPENAECPHHPATAEAHWWSRGYAYTSRLIRAIRAEHKVERLLAEAEAWRKQQAVKEKFEGEGG